MKVRNITYRVSSISYFKSFIKDMQEKPNLSYHYCFIYLTSYFIVQYIESVDWPAPQKETQIEKLIYAAFFSDINLPNPRSIKCRRPEDLENLTVEERYAVVNHAYLNAQVFHESTNLPGDIEKIITQHHGSLNGKEIEKYPQSGVTLLSQILFLSQEMATRMLTQKDPRKAIDSFKEDFKDFLESDTIRKFLASCLG